jgi:hypothetical protein
VGGYRREQQGGEEGEGGFHGGFYCKGLAAWYRVRRIASFLWEKEGTKMLMAGLGFGRWA